MNRNDQVLNNGMIMEGYSLYTGIILCVLGILMRAKKLNFLLLRYEGFQKVIRRRMVKVDKESLTRFYFIGLILIGGLLMITGMIQLLKPKGYEIITTWMWISVLAIGISGMLYCNITSRFLVDEDLEK
ncbi:MAG: DUF3784 domain-containing protein [Promethearchaeota archaeon]